MESFIELEAVINASDVGEGDAEAGDVRIEGDGD